MLDRVDRIVEILYHSRKDGKTLMLGIGCLIAFGMAVGASTVYESMARELRNSTERKDSGMFNDGDFY